MEYTAFVFDFGKYSVSGGSIFLRDICMSLPDYTVSQTRRQYYYSCKKMGKKQLGSGDSLDDAGKRDFPEASRPWGVHPALCAVSTRFSFLGTKAAVT